MRRSRVLTAIGIVVLALVGTGCGPDSAVDPANLPFPTPTIAGTPYAPVADAAAFELTEGQIDEIKEQCEQSIGETCEIPSELPRCTPESRWCLVIGPRPDADVGVAQVVEQDSDGFTCDEQLRALCQGALVPSETIATLLGAQTPTTPTTTSPDSPSPSPSTSTTTTEPSGTSTTTGPAPSSDG